MKITLLFLFLVSMVFSSCVFSPADDSPPPKPLFPDDPQGTNLPAGVVRTIDAHGNVVSIDHEFTTPQYTQAAVRLLLQEANWVAEEMEFTNEILPITEENVTGIFVPPFGFAHIHKAVGVVRTPNYVYMVSVGYKFSGLDVADYDQTCLKLEDTSLPLEQMDTNAACQLAVQWLSQASMDVEALNRDCRTHSAVSPYWNGLSKLGQVPSKHFVPIYYVWWTTPKNDATGSECVARVELFLPTKKLIHLSVHNPKYIQRQPLVFTNWNALFPGQGRVSLLPKATGSTFSPGPDRP